MGVRGVGGGSRGVGVGVEECLFLKYRRETLNKDTIIHD